MSSERTASRLLLVLGKTEVGPTVGLVVIAVLFEILSSGKFFSAGEVAGLTSVASAVGTIALGVTILMISGEFDLAVGATYAFVPIIMGKLINVFGFGVLLAFLCAMVLAVVIGFANGLITTRFRLPSFIVTLGTYFFLTGANYVITSGYPVTYFEHNLVFSLLGGHVLSDTITAPFLWFVAASVILWYVLTRTRYGNWTYATGGVRGVARALGVPDARVKIINFCLCSFLAGFSGCSQFAALNSVSAGFGQEYNLLGIVAAVVGGASLFGVKGSIVGTVVGSLILGSLQTGLVLVGAPGTWYRAFIGVILVVTVIVNVRLEQISMGGILAHFRNGNRGGNE